MFWQTAAAALLFATFVAAGEAPPPSDREAEETVRRLGDKNYDVREKADRDIRANVPFYRRVLVRHLRDEDLEIRLRATTILKRQLFEVIVPKRLELLKTECAEADKKYLQERKLLEVAVSAQAAVAAADERRAEARVYREEIEQLALLECASGAADSRTPAQENAAWQKRREISRRRELELRRLYAFSRDPDLSALRGKLKQLDDAYRRTACLNQTRVVQLKYLQTHQDLWTAAFDSETGAWFSLADWYPARLPLKVRLELPVACEFYDASFEDAVRFFNEACGVSLTCGDGLRQSLKINTGLAVCLPAGKALTALLPKNVECCVDEKNNCVVVGTAADKKNAE
jgi:hypothetical protein